MNMDFWGFGFQYGVSAIFSLPFYIKVIREEDRMQRKNEIGAYNEALPNLSYKDHTLHYFKGTV